MTTENPDHTQIDVPNPASSRVIGAPVGGVVLPLEQVADPVFSSGALGRGAAVRPSDGTFVAPIDGEIVTVMPHAYGIRGGGLEVLVHVGIDTVELNGAHFSTAVEPGQQVRAGDTLGSADLAAVAAAGFDTTVIVVITNSGELGDIVATVSDSVAAGEALLTAAL
jgi:PTS system beta-glucosides-specific IIC component